MPLPGPNTAFLLITAGILLTYAEFIWVGRVIFGVAGAIMALTGIAAIAATPHPAITGVLLIAGAIIFFALEAAFETLYLAGILASALWAIGFLKLCPILPQVAFPVSALFGAITTWLLSIAKRARRNKRLTH